MKRFTTGLLVIYVFASEGVAFAYGIPTHQELSEEAVNASVLQTAPEILPNFGLNPLPAKQRFPNSEGRERIIVELVQDGAEFEDNLSLSRVEYHFYDPVNRRPLTVGGIPLVRATSPDWALEDSDDLIGQDFSFRHARTYFLKALTLQNPTERNRHWGLTFQSLGHVIHHIQDMAQPQHVRNDPHLDLADWDIPLIESPSSYEKYTDGVLGSLPFSLFYGPVNFDTARKFWVTDEENGVGQGIAEFTNNNFVSAGTNFTGVLYNLQSHPDYPLPNGQSARVTVERIEDPSLLGPNQPLRGQMVFIGTPVVDRYLGPTSFNPRTSTYSIFDPDLTKYSPTFQATYSLNRFNFDAAHRFLIPRAVGYSAGLINYFFRGKIDMIPDPEQPDRYLIYNLSSEPMTGTFMLYYDDAADNRHPVLRDEQGNAVGWTTQEFLADTGGVLGAGTAMSVPAFSSPTDPEPKESGVYMLVFTGQLGEELPLNNSVGAVAAKRIGQPTDPLGILTPYGSLRFQDGQWNFTPRDYFAFGTTTWFGKDHTLSWDALADRSNGIVPGNGYWINSLTSAIYEQNRILTLAPGRVLGAALRRTALNALQLIAVVIHEEEIIPNSSWFFEPLDHHFYARSYPINPAEDWTLLATLPAPPPDRPGEATAIPLHPWVFNESGTEARNLYYHPTDSNSNGSVNYWDEEMVATIADEGVSFQSLGNAANPPGGSEPTGGYVVALDYEGDSVRRATVSTTGWGDPSTATLVLPGGASFLYEKQQIEGLKMFTFPQYIDLRREVLAYFVNTWTTGFTGATLTFFLRKGDEILFSHPIEPATIFLGGFRTGAYAMTRQEQIAVSVNHSLYGNFSYLTDGDLNSVIGQPNPIAPMSVD